MNFHTAFFTMVTSQGLGLAAAAQLLVDPTNTWLPWTVVLGILGLAILSTTKVVRFVDAVRRDIEHMEQVRSDVAHMEAVRKEIEQLKHALGDIRTLQQQVVRLEAHNRGVPPPDEMTGFGA
jgi:hypothetical protein